MTARHAALSGRELQILTAIADGQTSAAITRRFGITAHTLRTHLDNIHAKLGAHTRAHAVHLAHERGLFTARHGDHAGYTRHVRRGEDPRACPHGCWAGERAYRAQRRTKHTTAKENAR